MALKNNRCNDVSYIKLHGNTTCIATIKSSFDELKEEVLKDTHRDKALSYKTPALRKNDYGRLGCWYIKSVIYKRFLN